MESQNKSAGPSGTQAGAGTGYGATTPSNPTRILGFILRALAVVLTLVATIVMGAAKQTSTVVVTDPSTGTTEELTGTAKSTYSSAFVYFIVANVIVFVYSSVSMALTIVNRASSEKVQLPFSVGDLAMAALLFSSNGAAAAIAVIAERGNSHLGWDKFCDSVGKFCGEVAASIVLSMLAALAYVLLLVLSFIGLHRRPQ